MSDNKIVVVSAMGQELTDKIMPCWGRGKYHLLVNADEKPTIAHVLPRAPGNGCYGPYIANLIAQLSSHKVDDVLTRYLGQSTYDVFTNAGLGIYQVPKNATVEQAVQAYNSGSLGTLVRSNAPNPGINCSGGCGGCSTGSAGGCSGDSCKH